MKVTKMIDDADFKILDMRYKRIDECDRDMAKYNDSFHLLDKRLSVLEQSQRINNWLTGVIAGGIVALVIKVFLGG